MKAVLTKISALFASTLMVAAPTMAAPIVFKCNAVWDGPIIQTLTVDLDNRWMTFGEEKYEIRSVTDRYITGFDHRDVGGEIWVLDRQSGEYWRAAVYIGWGSEELAQRPPAPPSVKQNVYHGRCNRPI